jgi:hypothetical protein
MARARTTNDEDENDKNECRGEAEHDEYERLRGEYENDENKRLRGEYVPWQVHSVARMDERLCGEDERDKNKRYGAARTSTMSATK